MKHEILNEIKYYFFFSESNDFKLQSKEIYIYTFLNKEF